MTPTQLYLDLLKNCLMNTLYGDKEFVDVDLAEGTGSTSMGNLFLEMQRQGFRMIKNSPVDLAKRDVGRDWSPVAHTMIGRKRLDNVEFCVTDVLDNAIPGDLIEAGVWRGGTTILMRGILKAYEIEYRSVWVADSFSGVPLPDVEKYPADKGMDCYNRYKELAVPLEDVQKNFERYGLRDDQVWFVRGLFKDTLHTIPAERFAVIRLDGDLYESTMDALVALYPKLSVGGYCIADDYNSIPASKQAVHEYFDKNGIQEEIKAIDWAGAYWKKTK